ncbi:MAG: choice-of-anchor U domain-containing protein [Candidatus Saccharibacteria bacterium]
MITKLTKAFSALTIAAVAMLALSSHAHAATGITNIGHIGGYSSPPISEAQDVALDTQDNIYVFDGNHRRVIKYDSSGNYLLMFGAAGTGDGQFGYSYGIATDSADNLYVADTNNHRIQKFDSQGNYLSQFGSYGSGNGELNLPRDLVIKSDGSMLVADTGNNRVQIFDSSGVYQSQFEASADSLDLDLNGDIYVVTSSDIQKFNSSGVYQSQFGSEGSGDGQFSGATGISIDGTGNIFVLDNTRVQKFNSSGVYQSQFGSIGEVEGLFDTPRGIAIDSSANIYVADTYNNRIQKFDALGNFVSIIGGVTNQDLITAYTLKVHGNKLYIPFLEGDVGLVSYSLTGQFLDTWTSNTEIDYMVTTSPNYIYTVAAADGGLLKLKKLNYGGQTLDAWNLPEEGFGIAADSQDNVYWFNQAASQIYKYSSSGTLLNQFGSKGSGNGQFDATDGPAYLSVDNQDNLYVGDTSNHRIQKFDSSGNFLMKLGVEGSTAGEFNYLLGIAVSNSGDIYASDVLQDGGGRIQKFDRNGIYQTVYSNEARDISGNRYYPYGMDVGPNGRLYVALPASGSIDILCDHDVSTDNCQSTDGGGNTGQPLTYPDPVKGSTVTLVLPGDVTSPTVSAIDPKSLPKDSAGSYPAGLTSFQFTTTPGATKTVTLYYDLPGNPSDYTARKYKTDSKTYSDIPGATITREDYNGKSMLKLTYQITDGGPLDQDGLVNGTVIDPVGLATTSLAPTGESVWRYVITIIMLTLSGLWLGLKILSMHSRYVS